MRRPAEASAPSADHPFRGDTTCCATALGEEPIYPVPDPSFPFLGVTSPAIRRRGGGPNAVWPSPARVSPDGRGRSCSHARYRGSGGGAALWRMGSSSFYRSANKRVRPLAPEAGADIRRDDIAPGRRVRAHCEPRRLTRRDFKISVTEAPSRGECASRRHRLARHRPHIAASPERRYSPAEAGLRLRSARPLPPPRRPASPPRRSSAASIADHVLDDATPTRIAPDI